jgi:hypothetical protein
MSRCGWTARISPGSSRAADSVPRPADAGCSWRFRCSSTTASCRSRSRG